MHIFCKYSQLKHICFPKFPKITQTAQISYRSYEYFPSLRGTKLKKLQSLPLSLKAIPFKFVLNYMQ